VLDARDEQVVDTSEPRARLVERARRLFRNGLGEWQAVSATAIRADDRLLPGLLACRLAAHLTQPEPAARAGIARETLGRLERLRRRAQRETVQALAHALGVSEAVLATPTDGAASHTQSDARREAVVAGSGSRGAAQFAGRG
jgi:DNA-binding XRE family transcriptional regulator